MVAVAGTNDRQQEPSGLSTLTDRDPGPDDSDMDSVTSGRAGRRAREQLAEVMNKVADIYDWELR